MSSPANAWFATSPNWEQRFTQRPEGGVMKLLFGVYLLGIFVAVAYFMAIGLSHH